ncbi:MAG: response regulator transcription factor [Clostridia bacterium]|nr:response regulator transcription factor [Clostridia bacterium]
MEKRKILIADDEERIVRLVSDFLNAAGYETVSAPDGEQALELFNSMSEELSLAIIDIMMPGIDGWALTKEIRKTSNIPIIMLSARAEEFDLLTGFESGIDEYVTKPFSPAVLVKRVEALIRRSLGRQNDTVPENKGLFVDEAAFAAFVDGNRLELTLKEFELLAYLSNNSGRVLTRDQLLNAIWGYDYAGDTRTVDSHIARLRTKLGDYGAAHLKTIYGMGYKLER